MQQIRRHFATLVGMGAVILTTTAGTPAMAQTAGDSIVATGGAVGDQFGNSVGLSGSTAIVGAPRMGSSGSPPSDAGAAYVFVDSGGWMPQAQLLASDRAANDLFGYAVAVSGDYAVVGAPDDDNAHGTDAGAVYIFHRVGTTWSETQKILGGAAGDRFGIAVAIDGTRLAVGASQVDDGSEVNVGRAYLFDLNVSTWTLSFDVTPAALGSNDLFGLSVALSGDTFIVGARGAIGHPGIAYVYVHSGSWTLEDVLQPSDSAVDDQFGNAVAVRGNVAAVGSPQSDGLGAVYVFDRAAGDWTQSAKVRSAYTSPGDQIGFSVGIDGGRLVAGANAGFSPAGYVGIFLRDGNDWNEDLLTNPVTPDFGDNGFGTSVAIEGSLFLGGAPGSVITQKGSANFYTVDAPPPPPGDTDGDGLDDATEIFLANGGPCPDPFNPDTDGDGLPDGYENDFGPGICTADTDSDGLSDGAEVLTHSTNPTVADSDADGLNDGAEIGLGTNPLNLDTDGDGLNDGLEIAFATNPLVTDTDGDGLSDGDEVTIAAGSGCPNPAVTDSDGDGLNDGIEHPSLILDPCDADSDNDGLSDGAEGGFGTSPGNPDSDNDGLLDGQEVALAGAGSCPSPIDSDSDNDGVLDGDELTAGSGPCDSDSDDDGLNDANEIVFGTNPLDNDSDNDGMYDGAEVDAAMGSGCPSPLDSDSDNDGLNDGAETALHTSLCNPDTDGDGLNDGVDPNPLVPAITPHILACMTLATAGEFIDTQTNQFLGPNTVTKQVRKATLAATTALAAVAIEKHQYAAARALLTTVEKLIDGASPPADWMVNGPRRVQIDNDVRSLLTLLDLID